MMSLLDTDFPPIDATTAQPVERELRLYIAGNSPRCLRAIANLKAICDEHITGKYWIEVIDLLRTPHMAKADEIIAIPTLVQKFPLPVRKVIGDLSNTQRVLVGLQLIPQPT